MSHVYEFICASCKSTDVMHQLNGIVSTHCIGMCGTQCSVPSPESPLSLFVFLLLFSLLRSYFYAPALSWTVSLAPSLIILIVDLRAVAMSTSQHITMATGLCGEPADQGEMSSVAWPTERCKERERKGKKGKVLGGCVCACVFLKCVRLSIIRTGQTFLPDQICIKPQPQMCGSLFYFPQQDTFSQCC